MATTTSQINEIKEDLSDAYTALGAKGATLPESNARGTANLASTIATVPSPDPVNKAFDVTNGVLQKPTVTFSEDTFDGVTSVAEKGLDDRYNHNTNVNGVVSFPNVTSIGRQSFHATFSGTSISSISFPLLTSIPSNSGVDYGAMYYMCAYCKYLENVNFPELVTVLKYGLSSAFKSSSASSSNALSVNFDKLTKVEDGGFQEAFSYSKLKDIISFPKLETLGIGAFYQAFSNSSKISSGNINTVSFPSLTTVSAQSFNTCFSNCKWLTNISFPSLTTFGNNNAFINAFNGCTNLTEIHFRQDAQTSVEALTGYSSKWGATNATIYFDL